MGVLTEMQKSMQEVGNGEEYSGYYFKIADCLTIMVCGMLCGLESIQKIHMWASEEPVREFLLEQFQIRFIPKRAQFYNILARVNPEKFNVAFIKWMQYVLADGTAGKTVAIDGKTICSTNKLTHDNNPLHIATAIISENNLVIGSRECKTKMNEPEAFRELVKMLDITGSIVVADALHCKKKSAETVVKEGGDYLFVVKDNEPNLKDDIKTFMQNETTEKFSKTEKNGGRIERRTSYVSQSIEWLQNRKKWDNLKTIGAIHREVEKDGKKTSEWHYYISSARLSAENLLKHARLEWSVESMHWLLDVHFKEDKTRIWDMNVQKNLNIMRKIALNLVREYKSQTNSKQSLSGILCKNLFNLKNLANFLCFFFALNYVAVLLQN